jgi:hypothetical protein
MRAHDFELEYSLFWSRKGRLSSLQKRNRLTSAKMEQLERRMPELHVKWLELETEEWRAVETSGLEIR